MPCLNIRRLCQPSNSAPPVSRGRLRDKPGPAGHGSRLSSARVLYTPPATQALVVRRPYKRLPMGRLCLAAASMSVGCLSAFQGVSLSAGIALIRGVSVVRSSSRYPGWKCMISEATPRAMAGNPRVYKPLIACNGSTCSTIQLSKAKLPATTMKNSATNQPQRVMDSIARRIYGRRVYRDPPRPHLQSAIPFVTALGTSESGFRR